MSRTPRSRGRAARAVLAVLAGLGMLAGPGDARAGDAGPATATAALGDDGGPEVAFDRAAGALSQGDHAGAAAMFVQMAESHPAHPLAAEALFSAARLYEERLAEPGRALALYRVLVERHRDSRTALAASRRAENIERQLEPGGNGDAALAGFTAILQRFSGAEPGDPDAERAALGGVEALLAEYPGWPGSPRALLWLAEIHRRAGRNHEALARYLEVARDWPDSDEAVHAWRGAGDMAARLGRFDEAARLYHSIPVSEPADQRGRDDALASLARSRVRAHIYTTCHVIIAIVLLGLCASLRLAAGSAGASLRALARAPTEVVYMLPVAALLAGGSFTGHESVGPAVTLVCAGGLLLTWLSGAGLDAGTARVSGDSAARPPRRRLRLLAHAAAVALAVLALCYVAVHRGHLVDMLLDTVRYGPEV